VARQCIFIGTTNEAEYLGDSTGGRRWLPIRVGRIDIEAIRRDRDQLFAEAYVRYKAGETWHPDTDDFVKAATQEQSERTMQDPWLPPIESWVMASANRAKTHDPGWTTAEVLLHALDKSPAAMTKADQMRVAVILRELGLSPTRSRTQIGPSRIRRYRLARLDPASKNLEALSNSGPTLDPTSNEKAQRLDPE
jgi:putative DNA primase/helicase